jgi:nitrite reductase (NADH) large subunit
VAKSGRVQSVKFKDGTEVQADLVVMAVGISPQHCLAGDALLQHEDIVVGAATPYKITDARIYSVGECAALRHSPQPGGPHVR